ncbi:MAG: acyltransferase family protein [Bacteroidales bacterium]|nr:acyltransferase family protein [Bacteroidales bacterium]
MTRKHFLDNIRWTTVLLVLLYHVVYFYNNKGVFGGIGGWVDDPKAQPQDVVMYLLYPWFMMLLFLVAGISSRYALQKSSRGQWFKKRTRQLLVPSTIGLFVFHWMVGYFNTQVAGIDVLSNVPQPVKFFLWGVSGIGPLWFIQELWVFSLLLIIIIAIERDRLYNAVGRLLQASRGWSRLCRMALLLVGGFLLIWAGAQGSIPNPDPNSAQGLWNLYRPAAYLVPFLMGYYLFSRDSVQRFLSQYAGWLLAMAVVAGVALTCATWGENNTAPLYLMHWSTNLFAWLAILAMLACFKAWADSTTPFASYMTRSSYGIYIVHYLVIAALGYMLKLYTPLPPVADYLILTVAVFTLSPALHEVLRRIPFLRWAVLGIKKNKII